MVKRCTNRDQSSCSESLISGCALHLATICWSVFNLLIETNYLLHRIQIVLVQSVPGCMSNFICSYSCTDNSFCHHVETEVTKFNVNLEGKIDSAWSKCFRVDNSQCIVRGIKTMIS